MIPAASLTIDGNEAVARVAYRLSEVIALYPITHNDALPDHVAEAMERFASLSGRRYGLVEYVGDPAAERVVGAMGSACGVLEDTVEALRAGGERVGLLKIRLFRPFPAAALAQALPPSVRALAVLDRCKEPGSLAEPLAQDVLSALAQQWGVARPGIAAPVVLGGRYGLASKEFTPAMAKAVFDHLAAHLAAHPAGGAAASAPAHSFTVGIDDDVTHRSLPVDPSFVLEGGAGEGEVRAIFHGLGSDGTVGANKSTIKIIGASTALFCQAYFVYDSKKAGSLTTSHLRFGPTPIRSSCLIQRPTFVACHQWDFVDRLDLLAGLPARGDPRAPSVALGGGCGLGGAPGRPRAPHQHRDAGGVFCRQRCAAPR